VIKNVLRINATRAQHVHYRIKHPHRR
jgi:hypothetical protein